MTQSNLIKKYKNGNTVCSIYEDGTHIREWEDNITPDLESPVSLDLKLTGFCDAGCGFCFESSTKFGKHASKETVFSALEGLPAGAEIAIGGGNPFSHPDLEEILVYFKKKGLISNITVNSVHIEPFFEIINMFRNKKLIHGLGVSFKRLHRSDIEEIADENTVVHFIAGVHKPLHAIKQNCKKVLILGYKQFGFGLKFYKPDVEMNLLSWKYWINTIMRHKDISVSFDNLALEQLSIKDRIPPEIWKERYMGKDGTSTMYIDAVTDTFAVTSTKTRIPRNGMNVNEMFKVVKTL